MRQAEKKRKEFQTPIPLIPDPGEKIPKKNSKKIQKIRKQLFGISFSEIRDETGREREKRILDPNFANIQPEGGNSEKKNSKKIQKIREQLFGIIFYQIRMRLAEKE